LPEMRFKNRNKDKKAWVVSTIMGLGHIRPAYSLRDLAYEGIIMQGSRRYSTTEETKLWRKMRNFYYFVSTAKEIPIIGRLILSFLLYLEKIPSYYPRRDLSRPSWWSNYLRYLIEKKRLCDTIIKKIETKDLPVVNTYFASAMAIDRMGKKNQLNYLVICDADINRVWVPLNPRKSNIKYFAPCTQVKERLLSYGVPEKNIYLTGFPLPKENIGSAERMEILKKDLYERLLRLDPEHKFFTYHEKSVLYFLGKKGVPRDKPGYFNLTLSIGGAGAQTDIVRDMLKSLKKKICQNKIHVNLSAGVNEIVYHRFLKYIDEVGLNHCLGEEIKIIFDSNIYKYLDKFNLTLRQTDVLWTKPSELSFYCGLGIPILLAPPIGTHEEQNKRWLQETHTAIEPAGSMKYMDEWLFDLRKHGRLAEAAWDGFLKARKLGAFRIEEVIQTGKFDENLFPA
ncbi:MAG: hypothetical protein JW827_02585, partial [Spirochaetes bacterium]|nr:hypothetical protein [Spirochaetota bacterium]